MKTVANKATDAKWLDLVICTECITGVKGLHPDTGKPTELKAWAAVDFSTFAVIGWGARFSEESDAECMASAINGVIECHGVPASLVIDHDQAADVIADPLFRRYVQLGIKLTAGLACGSGVRSIIETIQKTTWERIVEAHRADPDARVYHIPGDLPNKVPFPA